ncbi:hypothetical protein [Bartonella sp. 1-1C]|uniref:hypothetical protein n=1 Tax=Bartonella sp. 1-1C TaxID=515256 RepID=UPI0001F4CC8F|nr:hypothetical protein [Bartonella sp. 1-1C]ATO57281.1 hypothetical protein B11Cv2_005070 [Bartonella sp. 1-1C]CBI80986.1 hypothetical protein B11C_110597 [Bartonella sp. 1-1C]
MEISVYVGGGGGGSYSNGKVGHGGHSTWGGHGCKTATINRDADQESHNQTGNRQ